VAATDRNFAIGTEVNQCNQILGAVDAHRKDPSENVRPHKATQATLKANAAGRGQRPSQVPGLEALRTQVRGVERHMRKRLNVKPGKQMMHYRVADEDHFDNLLLAASGKLRDHLSHGKAHDRGEIGSGQDSLDPVHHVGPE
jgi:hypothetical protein